MPRRIAAAALVVVLLIGGSVLGATLDVDDDGVDNLQELRSGTDPLASDTDQDGVPDGREMELGLDPTSEDSDGDGLTDGTEREIGSDPLETDTDQDGLEDQREYRSDTDINKADTDGDGLDDLREIRLDLDPTEEDTDGDRLSDGTEREIGSNPRARDTDGDGANDYVEHNRPNTDCNGNGIHAAAEEDDDSDHLRDTDEKAAYRCDADVDDDGVLDGREKNPECIDNPDCDGDGLGDGEERGTPFDPLDADTFGTGISDGVMQSFNEAGQPPSADDDGDGIPDEWETTSGPIEWGSLNPSPGEQDLLIEYVRVVGPDSKRFDGLDFDSAYREVEDFYETNGSLSVTWTETRVEIDEEKRPSPIPSGYDSYYERVLPKAEYSTNPYVTTVVMSPQLDQSSTIHLGAAPIKGKLAAIDYGYFTNVTYRFDDTELDLIPFYESIIKAGHTSVCWYWGWDDCGVDSQGQYYLRVSWFGGGANLEWDPFWFDSEPCLVGDSGTTTCGTRVDTTVRTDGLAGTIAHELGHTLGLCHLDLQSCLEKISGEDQFERTDSTMHPEVKTDVLRFLPSEWDRVDKYLGCPPAESIRKVAEGSGSEGVLDAKYGYRVEEVTEVDVLNCDSSKGLEESLSPDTDLDTYTPVSVNLE